FWSIFTFIMNALLFGLVGLQLQPILDRLSGYSTLQLVGYAVAVSGVVILTRLVWAIPLTYLPRLLFSSIRKRDPYPPWQQPAFVCWTGMRGAVTLAAALAIPLTTDAGTPFAGRDLIVFLAFCVVFATLVLQGLSMPLVHRALGLEGDGLDVHAEANAALGLEAGGLDVKEEAKARIHAADAAIARLDELIADGTVRADTAERLRGAYQFRQRGFRGGFQRAR